MFGYDVCSHNRKCGHCVICKRIKWGQVNKHSIDVSENVKVNILIGICTNGGTWKKKDLSHFWSFKWFSNGWNKVNLIGPLIDDIELIDFDLIKLITEMI